MGTIVAWEHGSKRVGTCLPGCPSSMLLAGRGRLPFPIPIRFPIARGGTTKPGSSSPQGRSLNLESPGRRDPVSRISGTRATQAQAE